jgi:hypothetical protein
MGQLPPNPVRLGPLAICIVAGLAIGIGVGAVVFNSSDDKKAGTAKAAADTRPIQLPASLAGFQDEPSVEAKADS